MVSIFFLFPYKGHVGGYPGCVSSHPFARLSRRFSKNEEKSWFLGLVFVPGPKILGDWAPRPWGMAPTFLGQLALVANRVCLEGSVPATWLVVDLRAATENGKAAESRHPSLN